MTGDDILRPSDYEFYRQSNFPGTYPGYDKLRSPQQLQSDLNKAHSNIKELVSERDRLQQAVMNLANKLEKEQKWRKWLVTALALTWTSWIGVVWWISKLLAPVILKQLANGR